MKIFLSADMEGTAGIVCWDETELTKPFGYQHFAEQMTKEVASACEGAIEAGASQVVVKDAHDYARNINPSKLPEEVRIIRGWTKDPYCMMAGLDSSFDGVILTGYHSAAGTNGNPLAHTMSTSNEYVKINGEFASEFLINAYTAALLNVPVLFLSGDKLLCESALKLNPNIKTVAVSEGIGNASISINPDLALKRIKTEVFNAAQEEDKTKYLIKLPEEFKVQIAFKDHSVAYKGSFYPGAYLSGPREVSFEAKDYFEVLRFFSFVL